MDKLIIFINYKFYNDFYVLFEKIFEFILMNFYIFYTNFMQDTPLQLFFMLYMLNLD